MLVNGWIIVELIGWLSVVRSTRATVQHVALVQRSANVRGFRDVGKTLAQLVSAGWVARSGPDGTVRKSVGKFLYSL